MFLQSLRVQNLRAIADTTFAFQPGLNVIIARTTPPRRLPSTHFGWCSAKGATRSATTRSGSATRMCSAGTSCPLASPSGLTRHSADAATRNFRPSSTSCVAPTTGIASVAEGVEYTSFQLRFEADFELPAATGRYQHVRGDLRGCPTWSNPVPREVLDGLRTVYLAPLRDLVNDRARVGAEIERLAPTGWPPHPAPADGRGDQPSVAVGPRPSRVRPLR
jgi:hypothetical protein